MIPGVQIFSPELFKQLAGGEKTDLPLLLKGRTVDATVLKVISPKLAELMVAGRRLVAETSLVLVKGQTLCLKATGAGGFEIVKPIVNPMADTMEDSFQKPPPATGLPLKALAPFTEKNPFSTLAKFVSLHVTHVNSPIADSPGTSNAATGNLTPAPSLLSLSRSSLGDLKDLLLSVSLKSGTMDSGLIPRVLEKSRLLLEKSLEILSQAQAGDKEALKPVADFVEAMEKFQVLNNHSSDSAKYLIPFPIFNADIFTFGQLFFDLGEKKNGDNSREKRFVRVSVFLTMTNLGALRVDLSVLNKEISALFQVEDGATASFIKTKLPTLCQRLVTQGFKVLQVECRRETPERISRACLAREFVKDDSSNLDLMVLNRCL